MGFSGRYFPLLWNTLPQNNVLTLPLTVSGNA